MASPEMPVPNGIYLDSGERLPALDAESIAAFRDSESEPDRPAADLQKLARAKAHKAKPDRGVIEAVEARDLAQAGWAIVFPSQIDSAIKRELQPLLRLRETQAGDLFRVFEGKDGYTPGESAAAWLDRHGTRLDVVDPLQGVPYYLLLIGTPNDIPFSFQYTLDLYWAVGRLCFSEPAEYGRYAETVVAYETSVTVPASRTAAVFATDHEADNATRLFVNNVALPLTSSSSPRGPIGRSEKFKLTPLIGDDATKQNLSSLLEGKHPQGRPSLLVTGSHGAAGRLSDPDLFEVRGAVVCQEYQGTGRAKPDDIFSAADVTADLKVHGAIHFFFACYSLGWPEFDTFRSALPARRIAPSSGISRLPQKLLSHPAGGALAALGHVDRAWSSSFTTARGRPQAQSFGDVMLRLLKGQRIGHATDEFNRRWAVLSADLADLLRDLEFRTVTESELASRWVDRDDARNYMVLGDPAVRLRVEDMPVQV